MEQLGLTRRNPTVNDIFNDLRDANRNIDFNSFLDIVVGRVGDNKTKEGLAKVFALWDKEGNGAIDLNCFKQIAR